MIATIDVQDKDEIAISTDDNEVTLTEDKIGDLYQATPSVEEMETE